MQTITKNFAGAMDALALAMIIEPRMVELYDEFGDWKADANKVRAVSIQCIQDVKDAGLDPTMTGYFLDAMHEWSMDAWKWERKHGGLPYEEPGINSSGSTWYRYVDVSNIEDGFDLNERELEIFRMMARPFQKHVTLLENQCRDRWMERRLELEKALAQATGTGV